jgi:ADP-ribose pyrophosphatase YjhB (NUDIX family)
VTVADLCNHTSVGVVPVRDGRILLGQRQKFPRKKAPCAGHVEELDGIPTGASGEEPIFRAAGVRELDEEFHLHVNARDLDPVISMSTQNRCRRDTVDGGPPWHHWWVYAVTIGPGQEPRGNGSEMTGLGWYTPAEALALPDLEDVWRTFLQKART